MNTTTVAGPRPVRSAEGTALGGPMGTRSGQAGRLKAWAKMQRDQIRAERREPSCPEKLYRQHPSGAAAIIIADGGSSSVSLGWLPTRAMRSLASAPISEVAGVSRSACSTMCRALQQTETASSLCPGMARAIRDHTGSHPAALKKFRHSAAKKQGPQAIAQKRKTPWFPKGFVDGRSERIRTSGPCLPNIGRQGRYRENPRD
jgi:hypothetical protein